MHSCTSFWSQHVFSVALQFGQLTLSDTVDLRMTFNLDSHKTHADGKLHDLTTYVILKYNGSLETCSSFSGSREFAYEGPTTASITYYVPRKFRVCSCADRRFSLLARSPIEVSFSLLFLELSCDLPLGMMDGSITNAQITASSHATGGEPNQGRLNSSSAWIPWMLLAYVTIIIIIIIIIIINSLT